MSDQIRGPDAADHAPKPDAPKQKKPESMKSRQQDAPNYDERVDEGLAEPVEKLDSAND